MKIVLSANTGWYLWNFRIGLVEEFSKEGHEVILIAPEDEFTDRLKTAGYQVIHLRMSGKGTSVPRELWTIIGYVYYLLKIRPAVYLGFTVKPVLYGGIAARLAGIPWIATITGLGTVFIKESFATKIVKLLYQRVLRSSATVFFQNNADMNFFVTRGFVQKDKGVRVPGSGVNLQKFSFQPAPSRSIDTGLQFLTLARLLRDKGIFELIEAAEIVKKNFPKTQFVLAGPADSDNPTSISVAEIEKSDHQGSIRYLGAVEDVIPLITEADCVILPSYREGLSRTLLEAAAVGRPVITTQVPGCADVVDDKVTGLLCQPRNSRDLAKKCEDFIGMSARQREEMGRAGREKVEREFSEALVLKKYSQVVHTLIGEQP